MFHGSICCYINHVKLRATTLQMYVTYTCFWDIHNTSHIFVYFLYMFEVIPTPALNSVNSSPFTPRQAEGGSKYFRSITHYPERCKSLNLFPYLLKEQYQSSDNPYRRRKAHALLAHGVRALQYMLLHTPSITMQLPHCTCTSRVYVCRTTQMTTRGIVLKQL